MSIGEIARQVSPLTTSPGYTSSTSVSDHKVLAGGILVIKPVATVTGMVDLWSFQWQLYYKVHPWSRLRTCPWLVKKGVAVLIKLSRYAFYLKLMSKSCKRMLWEKTRVDSGSSVVTLDYPCRCQGFTTDLWHTTTRREVLGVRGDDEKRVDVYNVAFDEKTVLNSDKTNHN